MPRAKCLKSLGSTRSVDIGLKMSDYRYLRKCLVLLIKNFRGSVVEIRVLLLAVQNLFSPYWRYLLKNRNF